MALKVVINDVAAQIEAAIGGKNLRADDTIIGSTAKAVTLGARDAGNAFKTEGRAAIAAGGLSVRWQNTWRVTVYPEKGYSLDPTIYGYHKIPYANIFNEGGTITPQRRGLLWVPTRNAPRGAGKKGDPLSVTPKMLVGQGVKLFSIEAPGKPPMLGAKVFGPINADERMTVSRLKLGSKRKKGGHSVPLFVGISSANIRKRFDLNAVGERIGGRLAEFYTARVEG